MRDGAGRVAVGNMLRPPTGICLARRPLRFTVVLVSFVLFMLLLPAGLAQPGRVMRRGASTCPDGLPAEALPEGVRLSWSHYLTPEQRRADAGMFGNGRAEFRIDRARSDEVPAEATVRDSLAKGYALIGRVDGFSVHEFLDATAEEGVTYRYVVTYSDGVESQDCASVEATAIPFFPAPFLAAGALLGSLGAFFWMRRRA